MSKRDEGPNDGILIMDPGEVFAGRYVIERKAGAGGAGIVYRAFDREANRVVALKVLHKADAESVWRFAAEADVLGKLDHPAIVRYLDHGLSEEGEPYLAMEWIAGETLGARLARGAEGLPVREVALLGHCLAGALDAAHDLGIVHRDVKPGNILLTEGGGVEDAKLADFGIVRVETGAHMTASGVIVGTVGYFSPEQARGERDLDGRADLFSLGCVLFRCLTNKEPFEGRAMVTVLAKVLLKDAPRAAGIRPDVPEAFDALIARMLAKDRDHRPASAREVQRELSRIASSFGADVATGSSPQRWIPSRGMLVALAALMAVLGFLFLGFPSAKAPSPPASAALASAPPETEPSCAPAAAGLYEQGLQAVHDARTDQATRLFAQAIEVDPACARAQYQLVITGEPSGSSVLPRERLRRATALRDRLNERERLILDAWTALVAPEVPHHDEAIRILEEGVRRYPKDADMLFRTGLRKRYVATDREGYEGPLDLARQATFLDPTFADAWHLQAMILGYLGRTDDKLRALDKCLEISPRSSDCLNDRMLVLKHLGRCEEAVAETRREIASGGLDTSTYWHLAVNLASIGASRESIEEALNQRRDTLSPDKRDWMPLLERSKLAVWMGEFENALRATEELARLAETRSDVDIHLRLAFASSSLLLELDRSEDAALTAQHFLQRKNVWIKGAGKIVGGASYYEPFFFATELEGGRLTPAAWRATTTEWDAINRTKSNDFERWVMRWGTAVGSRIGAAEAMAEMPRTDPAQTLRSSREFARLIGVMDAYEGRIRLLAGDLATAAPLLERSAHSCNSLDSPFLNLLAHLWLGIAREQLGEVQAACAAYGFVVDRWGHAKPRSKTADEAKLRRRRLGCAR